MLGNHKVQLTDEGMELLERFGVQVEQILPKTAEFFIDSLPQLKTNLVPRKDNLELANLHLEHYNKKRMVLVQKLYKGRLQML